MRFRAILCSDLIHPPHVPDMDDSDALFKHCYELQKIYAPSIPTFMIFPVHQIVHTLPVSAEQCRHDLITEICDLYIAMGMRAQISTSIMSKWKAEELDVLEALYELVYQNYRAMLN